MLGRPPVIADGKDQCSKRIKIERNDQRHREVIGIKLYCSIPLLFNCQVSTNFSKFLLP